VRVKRPLLISASKIALAGACVQKVALDQHTQGRIRRSLAVQALIGSGKVARALTKYATEETEHLNAQMPQFLLIDEFQRHRR
jgi:hypothetical protein